MSSAPNFRVALSDDALKYYNRVDIKTARRLDKCFAKLEKNPFGEADVKKMRGEKGVWRIRVGKLRLLYGVDLKRRIVEIYDISPRGDIY